MTELLFKGKACSHLFKDGEILTRDQLLDKVGPYSMQGLEDDVFVMKSINDDEDRK